MLTEQLIDQARIAGYAIEILSRSTRAAIERTQEVSRANRFSETRESTVLRESAEIG
jgi:hypothetical protein